MKYNNERINQLLENFPATNNAEEQLKCLVIFKYPRKTQGNNG